MTSPYLCVRPSRFWAISSPLYLAPGKDGWPTKSCNCFTSSCCPGMLTCGWTELRDLVHFWWGDGPGRSGMFWGDVCVYRFTCSVDRQSRDRPIIINKIDNFIEYIIYNWVHKSLSVCLPACVCLSGCLSLSLSLFLSLSPFVTSL